jgi:SAM-dependent methyltransferase
MFPLDQLGGAEGFDLGCGFGRHAAMVAPHVGKLHCIDPSANGIAVARRLMAHAPNVEFHVAAVDEMPLADGSQGFGYSMGVLHHIPDTEAALRSCVAKLRPGAPFLLYLYYSFDNRPFWFRQIWRLSDAGRRLISRMPFRARKRLSDAIGLAVYWPLSRAAGLLERAGFDVENFPLGYYRRSRLGNLRAAALDRFGTGLEHRFSRAQIEAMMVRSGLGEIRFREQAPYWVALGRKT